MISWAGVLTIAFWGIVALLLAILCAIARFYQFTSGQNTRYRWFAAPVLLLSAGALRYALSGDLVGDALGDALIFAGSISVLALSGHLVGMMMGGRR
jgi:hypothetical protein